MLRFEKKKISFLVFIATKFVVTGWVVLTPWCRKAYFVNLCHNHNLESRPQKVCAVHFSWPKLPLFQISKIMLNQFWHEKQKSLLLQQRWRQWLKQTENVKWTQTSDLIIDFIVLYSTIAYPEWARNLWLFYHYMYMVDWHHLYKQYWVCTVKFIESH